MTKVRLSRPVFGGYFVFAILSLTLTIVSISCSDLSPADSYNSSNPTVSDQLYDFQSLDTAFSSNEPEPFTLNTKSFEEMVTRIEADDSWIVIEDDWGYFIKNNDAYLQLDSLKGDNYFSIPAEAITQADTISVRVLQPVEK